MRAALDRIAALAAPGTSVEIFPWSRLRYVHTQALRARLVEQGLAPSTVARHLAALRGVLREAWQLGQLSTDDYTRAAAVQAPRGSRLLRGRALTAREVAALFAACDDARPAGARDRALLALLYGGGLRRAEVASLELADLEGEAVALRVRGKGDRERRVPLPGGARRAVLAWLTLRGRTAGPLLRAVRGRAVLDGGMGAQSVFEALVRLAKRAGVKALSPHDLRRTYVSDLLDAGADIATVQRLAGHALVTTTARYDRRGDAAAERTVDLLRVPF
jgi:site-specific recombinase XerD